MIRMKKQVFEIGIHDNRPGARPAQPTPTQATPSTTEAPQAGGPGKSSAPLVQTGSYMDYLNTVSLSESGQYASVTVAGETLMNISAHADFDISDLLELLESIRQSQKFVQDKPQDILDHFAFQQKQADDKLAKEQAAAKQGAIGKYLEAGASIAGSVASFGGTVGGAFHTNKAATHARQGREGLKNADDAKIEIDTGRNQADKAEVKATELANGVSNGGRPQQANKTDAKKPDVDQDDALAKSATAQPDTGKPDGSGKKPEADVSKTAKKGEKEDRSELSSDSGVVKAENEGVKSRSEDVDESSGYESESDFDSADESSFDDDAVSTASSPRSGNPALKTDDSQAHAPGGKPATAADQASQTATGALSDSQKKTSTLMVDIKEKAGQLQGLADTADAKAGRLSLSAQELTAKGDIAIRRADIANQLGSCLNQCLGSLGKMSAADYEYQERVLTAEASYLETMRNLDEKSFNLRTSAFDSAMQHASSSIQRLESTARELINAVGVAGRA